MLIPITPEITSAVRIMMSYFGFNQERLNKFFHEPCIFLGLATPAQLIARGKAKEVLEYVRETYGPRDSQFSILGGNKVKTDSYPPFALIEESEPDL